MLRWTGEAYMRSKSVQMSWMPLMVVTTRKWEHREDRNPGTGYTGDECGSNMRRSTGDGRLSGRSIASRTVSFFSGAVSHSGDEVFGWPHDDIIETRVSKMGRFDAARSDA